MAKCSPLQDSAPENKYVGWNAYCLYYVGKSMINDTVNQCVEINNDDALNNDALNIAIHLLKDSPHRALRSAKFGHPNLFTHPQQRSSHADSVSQT
jgi:hypothetical protein